MFYIKLQNWQKKKMCQAKNIFDRQNLLVIAAYGVVKINHIMWEGSIKKKS